MWISKYFVYFIIFSCMGWIYETIYCTIKGGKWENRGFLYGPVCPIYGVGAASIVAIMNMLNHHKAITLVWWQVFLVAFFGSIVLEYVTSWGLEKLFHAYWWDYSDVPLNINGRVCFPASVGFGVGGLIVVYGVAPFTMDMTEWMTPILMELFGLIFMGLITVDATLTVSALTNFERYVVSMDDILNQHMDQFVNTVQEKTQLAGNLLAEERTRFAQEHIRGTVQNMSGLHRAALSRVKGFRTVGTGTASKVKNTYIQYLKKYIPKRKKHTETSGEIH